MLRHSEVLEVPHAKLVTALTAHKRRDESRECKGAAGEVAETPSAMILGNLLDRPEQ
jgi:hypothetical protein